MTLRLRAALVVLALSGVGACGGGGASPVRAGAVRPPGPAVVSPPAAVPCSARLGLPLPAGWPGAVPLPPGFVVTRTQRRSNARLIAYGRTPGDFHVVVSFFNARLPAAGFVQRNGQLDPFDAESDFAGRGTTGRWTAGLSPACPDQSSVTVLVGPG